MRLRLQRNRSRGRRLRAALGVCLPPCAALVLAGCGGARAGASSREADELRFQNTRREEELRKAEEVVRLLKAQAAALASERDALQGQLVDLRAQVRGQRQGMDQLEADRGAAEERHRQALERNEDLRKTLERATSLLGFVGDEVASLRAELRGMEAGSQRPRGQAEDLDFIEKSALLSARIEQLHFEILRERALLGAFSRPRTPTPAPPTGEPGTLPAPDPAPPPLAAATPLPQPLTEPREEPGAGEPPREAAPPAPGILGKLGGAIGAVWQWLPLERIGKLLEMAILIGGAALALGVIALSARRLSRRLGGAASRLLASLRRRPQAELAIEEDPGAREPPGRGEEDLEDTAQLKPAAGSSEGREDPETEGLEIPAREAAGAIEEALAGTGGAATSTVLPAASTVQPVAPTVQPVAPTVQPVAPTVQPVAPTILPVASTILPETPVIAESADFFQAFQEGGKEAPREPPRRPRPPPRRAAAASPGAPPARARAEDRSAGPDATQAIERTGVEPPEGEGAFTQVIPGGEGTEWNLTQELPREEPETFEHTQVIPEGPREDFLSTQVIPAIPDVEGPRPAELFPPDLPESAPTQVIREPRGLKGEEWPPQKPKGGARPPRPEKRGPPRKQPPSDRDLLAELEELIGRKIDESSR